MSIDAAEVALTQEPSGEIRLRVTLPNKRGAKQQPLRDRWSEAAGCGALVYSSKLREKVGKRSGFGGLPAPTTFGRAAKRAVKNAVGALEQKFGRKVVFATVTLPGSTDRAREEIARWSAEAVQLLTHWIQSKASGAHYTYVWERQKSGALHLHVAIGHSDVLRLRALEHSFKGYVHRMFSTISRLAGWDLFARRDGGSWKGCVQVLRSNCVPVRKSVKRYMSKYMSKGVGEVKGHSQTRWWGCSRNLRAVVQRLRRCAVWRVSSWQGAAQLAETCAHMISTLDIVSYHYSIPYSPSSIVYLMYPDDIHTSITYNLFRDAITEWRQVERSVRSGPATGMAA